MTLLPTLIGRKHSCVKSKSDTRMDHVDQGGTALGLSPVVLSFKLRSATFMSRSVSCLASSGRLHLAVQFYDGNMPVELRPC